MLAEEVKYCPRCGSRVVPKQRAGKVRPVCPSCDWIFFPDPKVAAGVLIKSGSKVLLVRRSNSPRKGFWTLPVGFVDAGEDPAKAAERECWEETGLQIRASKLLDIFASQEHPRGAHFVILYQGNIISGELRPGDDVDQVKFFNLEDLPPLAFSTTRVILERFM
jgi:ADP-ribose pyrophosphatase YjhB (NUDIX family)